MPDRVCRRCWSWFPGTVATCSNCGGPLTAAEAASPQASQPLGPLLSSRPRRRGAVGHLQRTWLRWTLILAILAVLACAVFPLPQLGLWGNPGCSFPGTVCTRVLFIGNSYTAVNDLPDAFADVAWAGGHRVSTGALDPGGYTLAEHVSASDTAATIESQRWNVVVLQDQSEMPAFAEDQVSEMDPAATTLVGMVRRQGAQPLFYETMAHQDGDPEYGLPDYASMQAAIDAGYLGIAAQLSAPVAPVGDAWQTVVDEQASPGLWQSDGSHPTTSGTYLAACVFYASIFDQSPVGLGFHDGLSGAEALTLQKAASATVLGDLSKWGLPIRPV